MSNYIAQVEKEYEEWVHTPPNVIQRGMGVVTKPLEKLLEPAIAKVSPLLENVLKSLNDILAKAIQKFSKSEEKVFLDLVTATPMEFEQWLRRKDKVTKHLVTAGASSLAAEGAGTGLGGFALLAVDIPASFGLILTFANVIALHYELDIYDEQIQEDIIKAITAGSETTLQGKIEALATLRIAMRTINTTTWKAMAKAPANSMPGLIIAIKSFLKKMGVNITKRKAAQLIPGLGAVAGGVINSSWALDSLEAVRQITRKSVVNYFQSHTQVLLPEESAVSTE